MSAGDGGGGRGHVHARERDRDRDRALAPARGAQHEAPSQPEAATAPMTPISFAKAFNWGAAGGATPTPPPAPPPSPLGRPVAPPGSAPERAADAAEARQRGAPDLTGVRVHTDARADGYARSLGADALTLGQDIFVARAAWNPGSAATNALLAHELHHARHGQAGVVYRKATIPTAPTSSAAKPEPHSAAAADDARVAKSADPALNGKTVAAIRTLLRAKLGRYQSNARLLKEAARQSQAQEERWASERTWAERAAAYAAGVTLPDPKRWAGVAHLFEIADGQLTSALAHPATGDTLPELGRDMARGLKSFQYGVQESQARSRDFARYAHAVADSAEAITDDLSLVRDMALAMEVSLIVVAAAPALFAAGSTAVVGAGGTATAGSMLAGSATVAGGGVAIGAAYEGQVRLGAKALHEATKVVEAVFDPDTTIDAALGQIDWKGLESETFDGLRKGAIDGLIAAISYGADKLMEPMMKAAGVAAAAKVGGSSAFGQMAIRVLTRALAAATAGGASGAVLGALQGALDAASRGGGKDDILAAAKDGFIQGGAMGLVIGGTVGLAQAASAERGAARAVPDLGGSPAAPPAEPTLTPGMPTAPHAEPTLSPEAPSAAPAADAPGVAVPVEPAPLAESPAPPTAHDAGPRLSALPVEPPALVDLPPAAEPGSIPAELAPEGVPTNSIGEPTVTPDSPVVERPVSAPESGAPLAAPPSGSSPVVEPATAARAPDSGTPVSATPVEPSPTVEAPASAEPATPAASETPTKADESAEPMVLDTKASDAEGDGRSRGRKAGDETAVAQVAHEVPGRVTLSPRGAAKLRFPLGTDIVYVVRDGESVLKVGKTSAGQLQSRAGVYARAGEKLGMNLTIEVIPVQAPKGTSVESIETAVRSSFVGDALPWDNTGGRLGRGGPGTPWDSFDRERWTGWDFNEQGHFVDQGAGASRAPARSIPGLGDVDALMATHGGNVGAAAKAAGVDPRTIYRWLQGYGLTASDYRP